MKILFLGSIPDQLNQFRTSDNNFVLFQPHNFWVKALKELGHQVETFIYTDSVFLPQTVSSSVNLSFQKYAPRIYNKLRYIKSQHYKHYIDNLIRSQKLSALIQEFRPDLLIITGGISELLVTPFNIHKRQGGKLVLFHGVHPAQLLTGFERDHIDIFDLIITNDPSHADAWRRAGAVSAVNGPYVGVDSDFHTKNELAKQDIDVSFVGTLFTERQKELCSLLPFKPHIYGHIPIRTTLLPELASVYRGALWGPELVKVYNRSKIVLNYVPGHMKVGGNIRTFEIPGSGAVQLVNRCPDEWFVHDKEVVVFNSTKQLHQQISYLLDNPQHRNKLALAGYHRAHKDHTYKKRADFLLNQL